MGHTATCDVEGLHAHHDHEHPHDHAGHGHSHGLVDRSIVESRDGVKTVSINLAVLTAAAIVQTIIFITTGSVALLADLIHITGRRWKRDRRRARCPIADPIIGIVITLVILKITWDSWQTIYRGE
jgi:Co/Zn/Cd efflux system component